MYGAEAITTGTDLVTASSKMMTVKKDAEMEPINFTALAGSLGGLAKSMTLLVQSNLLQNEILFGIKDAILGLGPTDQEKKEDSIEAGDTDTDKKKGPGILSKVGSTLGKLNPFGGGGFMDTLLKLGLAVGGLALLNIFGDKLTGPLAGLIKAFKEGKIGEKIEEIVTDIQEYLTPLWDKIKIKVGEFIGSVKKVMGIIQGAYKVVNDYVMSFDTEGGSSTQPNGSQTQIKKGDGKINKQEMKALTDDLKKRAVAVIGDFFKDLMLSVGGAILTATFIGTTTKMLLANPAIKNIFGFGAIKAIQGPVMPGQTLGMSKLFARAGIGALLLYGITTTYKNVTDSMAQTLKENNGKFVASGFFANFFGGNDKGGAMNALKQAFLVGGTGTLAGLGIAGIMASMGAVAGPPGIIAGGLIGLAIGGIIGIMTGLTGSEKLEKMFKKFGTKVNDTIDSMNGFFDGILDNIRSYFTGSTTKYETDEGAMTSDLEKLKQEKKDAELDILEREKKGFFIPFEVRNKPAKIQEKIDDLTKDIENVDAAKAKYDEEQAFSSVKGLTDSINYQKGMLNNRRVARDLAKAIEYGNTDTEARIREKQKNLSDKILKKELEKQAILKEAGVDYQIPMLTQMDYSKDFNTIVDPRYQNTGKMLNPGGPSHPSNATIISTGNDSSIKKQETQNLFGPGMSQDNPQFASILAYNQSKLKTG